jgi:hypothetical protein
MSEVEDRIWAVAEEDDLAGGFAGAAKSGTDMHKNAHAQREGINIFLKIPRSGIFLIAAIYAKYDGEHL